VVKWKLSVPIQYLKNNGFIGDRHFLEVKGPLDGLVNGFIPTALGLRGFYRNCNGEFVIRFFDFCELNGSFSLLSPQLDEQDHFPLEIDLGHW